jgi:hypothetical protein
VESTCGTDVVMIDGHIDDSQQILDMNITLQLSSLSRLRILLLVTGIRLPNSRPTLKFVSLAIVTAAAASGFLAEPRLGCVLMPRQF